MNGRRVWPVVALAGCGVAAWSATLIDWNSSARQIVPFAILGLVMVLGMVFGRSVGILGSIIAAIVFAYAMYEPVGSVRVANQDSRAGLAWMVLAGVTLSYLLLPAAGDHSKRGH